jgi:hypothetical protein
MDCQHCYEVGIREGYESGFDDARRGSPSREQSSGDRRTLGEIQNAIPLVKEKRKPSAYNKKYAKAFKKIAPSFKKKNGSWKMNGFKNCSKKANGMCKK